MPAPRRLRKENWQGQLSHPTSSCLKRKEKTRNLKEKYGTPGSQHKGCAETGTSSSNIHPTSGGQHLGSLKVHKCTVLRGHLCPWWWRECLPIIYSLPSYLKCQLTALNAFEIQHMQKAKHFVSWMTPCWDDKWSQRTTFQDMLTASRKIFPCTVRLASLPLVSSSPPFPSGIITVTITSSLHFAVICLLACSQHPVPLQSIFNTVTLPKSMSA